MEKPGEEQPPVKGQAVSCTELTLLFYCLIKPFTVSLRNILWTLFIIQTCSIFNWPISLCLQWVKNDGFSVDLPLFARVSVKCCLLSCTHGKQQNRVLFLSVSSVYLSVCDSVCTVTEKLPIRNLHNLVGLRVMYMVPLELLRFWCHLTFDLHRHCT